jgi:hypothetical protein
MAKRKTVEPVAKQRTQLPAAIHEPTHAEIQDRASYRYVDRGRINGSDGEDWRLAETALRGGDQPAVRERDELSRVRQPTATAAVRSQTSDAEAGSSSV